MSRREAFIEAMRRSASAVAVVTTGGAAGSGGLTVSALCPVSADPPSLLVCVNKLSRALDLILGNRCFCVNLLSADQQDVADSFAGRVPELREKRFGCGAWRTGVTGAPELLEAVATLNCNLASDSEFGSHRILIGEIVEIAFADREPLIYMDRAYRTVGDVLPAKRGATA